MAESDLSTSPIPQAGETFTRSKQEHPHIRLWTNRPGFTEVLLLQHRALGQTGLVSFNPWFPLFWGCFLQLSLKELTTRILRHFCYTCVCHWCALSASACPWTCVRACVCVQLPFPLPLSYWSQCCGALCWLDSSGQGLPSPDVTDGLSRQHADRWPSLRAPPRVHALE